MPRLGGDEGLRAYILSFPDGGARLEIMSRPEVTDTLGARIRHGFIHFSISVGSEEAVNAKAREFDSAGYACVDGPRTTGDGYYEAQVTGPEGMALEITV